MSLAVSTVLLSPQCWELSTQRQEGLLQLHQSDDMSRQRLLPYHHLNVAFSNCYR